MPTSDLSHLTTLSALAKSAEARTPLPAPAVLAGGSGVIDLKAMEQRARELANAPKPAPVVSAAAALDARPTGAPFMPSEPDLMATMAARARKTRLLLGGVAGAAALVAFAAVWLGSGSSADPKPAPAAVAEARTPAIAPTPIPPPVAEVVASAVAPAPPSTAGASASPAPATGKSARGKVRRAPAHPASHGPHLMKVASSGT